MATESLVQPTTVKEALDGLKNLPAKERAVTRTEALKALRKELKTARSNGYSVDELVVFLKTKGIEVKASTVRQVLSGPKRSRRDDGAAGGTPEKEG